MAVESRVESFPVLTRTYANETGAVGSSLQFNTAPPAGAEFDAVPNDKLHATATLVGSSLQDCTTAPPAGGEAEVHMLHDATNMGRLHSTFVARTDGQSTEISAQMPQSPIKTSFPVYSGFAQLNNDAIGNIEENNAKQFFYQNRYVK